MYQDVAIGQLLQVGGALTADPAPCAPHSASGPRALSLHSTEAPLPPVASGRPAGPPP